MITINNYKFADIGFYINLDQRLDRKKNIEDQFNKYNICGVQRYSANQTTQSSPLNCKLSHYALYKQFLQSNLDLLLILEDDCLFFPYLYTNTLEIYNNIFSTNFDLFWLGCRNRRTPKFFKNKCYQVQSVSHAQSYIINRKLCEYIINNFPELGHNSLAIDELLSLVPFGYEVVCDPNKYDYYKMDNPLDNLPINFTALCYERALTTQYRSYSDLVKTDVDYEYYIASSYPVSFDS